MFSIEFSENSKRIFFTENLWTTASGFSFSEAATGGVLWKKVFLKISQNLQENTCGLRNFQEHHFYWTPLDDYFWLFPASLLKWNTANSVWKISAATRVEVLCKKGVFKNFVNFLEKHLCWSLINKVAGLTPILKKICQRLLLHCTRTTQYYFFLTAQNLKLDKNYIFQTTRFNHSMIFFKLTD